METTSIYTPVKLKGNTYRSLKNNGLVTILEVGPNVTNISLQSELALAPEYLQISTAEIITGILYNRLVFAGKASDREETAQLNEQVKVNAPYGFKPGHKYVKLGARNAVIKGGERDVKLSDDQAKASRPYKKVHICTVMNNRDHVWNTLRLRSESSDDTFITVDESFEGLHFTAVKTQLVMEVTEVGKTGVTCKVGQLDANEEMADVRFERTFEMSDFIHGIEDGRIKPEPAFYDMVAEELMRIESYNDAMDEHLAYFDGSEEPKDFGTDESVRAQDFQWVAPRQKRSKVAPTPKLHTLAERATFKSKCKTREELIAWANEAFKD